MLHVGRCGSTVLGDLLNQHPDIFWDGEIYEIFRKRRGSLLPWFDPMKYLRLRTLIAGTRFYAFEIKINYTQLQQVIKLQVNELLEYLNDEAFDYFIILERKNYFRTILSVVIGQQTDTWHIPNGSASQIYRTELDVSKPISGDGNDYCLLKLLDEITKNYSKAKKLLLGYERVLYLNYEYHIMNNPLHGCRLVIDFLGLEPHYPVVNLQKTNPYSVRDMLLNFDEVENTLAGTPYHWMLFD